MKRRVLLPLFILPLCAAFCVPTLPTHPTQSAESYAVYSVLIPQIASVPPEKFLIAADTVPYAETKSQFPVEPDSLVTKEDFDRRLAQATPSEWSEVWRSQPCVLAPEAERDTYLSAMTDYRRNNEIARQLDEHGFNLPRPYEPVDVSELVGEKRSNRWTFAEKNGAHGVYELSDVGFSSDMTLAIVYVGYDCPRCGRWALHILKKADGKWKQVAVRCDAMS